MPEYVIYIITNLLESGDLCGNITEFGMTEWSLALVIHLHPKLSDIAIQISKQRLFCFHILLFNDFMSFSAKVYEINMYLFLYLSFKIKV